MSTPQAVRSSAWQLNYQGKDITKDILLMVEEITYTSKGDGASSDLDIKIEDSGQLWQGPWYPTQGDVLTLWIGYSDAPLVACGSFQIDQPELEGPPDVMHIHCLTTDITPSLRTPNTIGYENQTLPQIAQTIATKHGLTVVGAPASLNVTFKRKTQRQETDIAFLHRLSNQYNYDFTIKAGQLIFRARTVVEQAAPILTIARQNIMRFEFIDKSHGTYKAAQVNYFDPHAKALNTATAPATAPNPTGDTLKIRGRAENGQDAMARATAEIHKANMNSITARITTPGNTNLAAGVTVTIQGFGVFSGKFLIHTAKHQIQRASGYTTSMELRKIPD